MATPSLQLPDTEAMSAEDVVRSAAVPHVILRPLHLGGLLRKGPCARQFRLQPRDHAPGSVYTAVDFLDLIEKIDLAQKRLRVSSDAVF